MRLLEQFFAGVTYALLQMHLYCSPMDDSENKIIRYNFPHQVSVRASLPRMLSQVGQTILTFFHLTYVVLDVLYFTEVFFFGRF